MEEEDEGIALDLSAEEYEDEYGLVRGEEVLVTLEDGVVLSTYRLMKEDEWSVPLAAVESWREESEGEGVILKVRDGRVLTLGLSLDHSAINRLVAFLSSRCGVPVRELFGALYGGVEPTAESVSLREGYRVMGAFENESGFIESALNKDFALCASYPLWLMVPSGVSDDQLRASAQYRSRGRLPVLSWMAAGRKGVLLRCSQPLVGVSRHRSAADEAVVGAVAVIVDARPRAAATANRARGGGTEGEGHYGGPIVFCACENIHSIRSAFESLREMSHRESIEGNQWAKSQHQWLQHVQAVLKGAQLVAGHLNARKSF